jgi:hypothetical protein
MNGKTRCGPRTAISSFRLVSGEVHGGHSLPNFTRDIKNCTAEECRRGTPLNISQIEGSDIPDDAVALPADLGSGELLLQFFGDEMIFLILVPVFFVLMKERALRRGTLRPEPAE